jgi:putative tricarboxylic transport membrane protein
MAELREKEVIMSAVNAKEVHQPNPMGHWGNQVFALLWVVVGIIVLIQTRDLKFMAEYGPGPGFLPFWLGLGAISLGLVLLAQVTFSRKEKEVISLPSKYAAWQMFLVMFGFFMFVILAEKVGFLFCIGLLFLFLLVVVERKGWKFSLAIAIINTLIFWAIFELGLKLQLPAGLLDLLR